MRSNGWTATKISAPLESLRNGMSCKNGFQNKRRVTGKNRLLGKNESFEKNGLIRVDKNQNMLLGKKGLLGKE